MIEDYTDEFGIPAWVLDDEAVEVDAVKRIHKFRAARDRATQGTDKHPYKPEAGEYFIPDIFSRRSDESIQTFSEWVKSRAEQADPDKME